jgi:predicted metalloendopeptidase
MDLQLSSLFPGQRFGELNHVISAKNQVKTDPHSPGMYRAYVPLQNVDAFTKHSLKGDGMYIEPEKKS